jgi:hypothetical protein
MRAFAAHRHAAAEDLVGRVLCHDVRGPRGELLLRKGHALLADDLPSLFEGGEAEVHLLELEPEDLGQRPAGQRLAEALRAPGLLPLASGHRHVLRAAAHGLLDVDGAALQRINAVAGVAILTLPNGSVVAANQVVAQTQITPLAVGRSVIEEVEAIARERNVVRLRTFTARDAILWKPDDRIVAPLTDKLRRYGCRLREVLDLPRDAASIRASIEERLESGATLLLIAGSNALDPLDAVFEALEQLGATMRRRGVPVHPGTLLWIATRGDVTFVGLPSCGMGQVTAFDLILPRLLAAGANLEEELASLGQGGLLVHTRARTFDEEPVDDPVR